MNAHLPIEAFLEKLKIKELNPMQNAMMAAAKTHPAIVLLSNTGSGKTLAFLLPLLDQILQYTTQHPELNGKGTQAVIVAPSRELALQTEQVIRKMGSGFSVTCCYGGHKREIEENNLQAAPNIIVGTPGRLADHFRRENIDPTHIHTIVLDEFDKCMELGFHAEMEELLSYLTEAPYRYLISATTSSNIPAFARVDHAEVLQFIEEKEDFKLSFYRTLSPQADKLETLLQLLCTIGNRPSIIFCNHRESVHRIAAFLKEKGVFSTFYHGALEQQERENNLFVFRNGTVSFLITTDLAARGLDIPHIRYIIHYHLPATADSWTHRNGRTARMDASGSVVVLMNPEEVEELEDQLEFSNNPTDQQDSLPNFLEFSDFPLLANAPIPPKPEWTTLFIQAGKKDKINKVDIVGFLAQKGGLKKEDIGLIEVKDFYSFAAIRKSKANVVLERIKNEKLKNKKIKIQIARLNG